MAKITVAHDSWWERNPEDGFQYSRVAFFLIAEVGPDDYVHEHRFDSKEEAEAFREKVWISDLPDAHFGASERWTKLRRPPSLEEQWA